MDILQCMKEHKIDMTEFESFLESSSISGLNHISTTRRYGRLFWVFIVLTGFTVSGFLIYESFQAWEESPVKTTIETFPITELTFPKVTVCPPRNTYTNLNYDLMMTENMTLDDETKNELIDYAVELLHNNLYDRIMANMSKLQVKDRYHNWYNLLEDLDFPWYSPTYDIHNFLEIWTRAPYGSIHTQYFDEEFSFDNVELRLFYRVNFIIHESLAGYENITLHIKVEKNSIKDLSSGHDKFTFDFKQVDAEVKTFAKNFTPPPLGFFRVDYDRAISKEDVRKLSLSHMPGFKITWHYTDNLGRKLDNIKILFYL